MRMSPAKEIPPEIVLFCIVSDNQEHLEESQQIGVDKLLAATGQIGKYMNLSYASLLEILQLLENMSKLTLVNNFGDRYVQLKIVPAMDVISDYYQKIVR